MKYGFGIDLGGTTAKLAFFQENGRLLHKWEISTDTRDGGSHILPDIAAAIAQYVSQNNISKADLLGIGIGVPGPVLPDGTVNRCVNLGWGVFNIEKALHALTGLPVKAANDANVATLGECRLGNYQNMVLVIFGTGVGGGIVLNGQLLPGSTGSAGEMGHMVLRPEETEVCSCGKKGCVEQYCSAPGILRIAQKHLAESDTPSLLRSFESLSCKDIFDVASQGDKLAQAILEQVYDYMGQFLGNVCSLVNPQWIVLGGGVSHAGQPLVDGIRRHFPKYVFHAAADVEFTLATLGNDAGIYGAFQLLL